MHFPENILYTKDHEWLKITDGFAFIGITDFAQKELGDILYVEIETVNETLKQNEVFGTIEAVKTVSDLFMPLGGVIIEINPKIISNPELMNNDPYGEGWLIKIKASDKVGSANLLNSQKYKALLGLN